MSSAAADLVRFRCACGRSVVTERGTPAAAHQACSRCRRRWALDPAASLKR